MASNYTQPLDLSLQQGWTPQPDGRGTWDILWTSIFTAFLCAWSCLCLNLPAKDENYLLRIVRKVLIAVLALLAPECVMGAAVVQLMMTQQAFKAFHDHDFPDWTMEHGFYAEMGGFMLKTNDNFPAYPVDGLQLLYLIEHKFLEYPSISREDIKDKNKVDSLLRCITIAQVLYFFLNNCVRAAKGYAVTCLEITTLAIIPCSLGTWYAWRQKPADIGEPTVLYSGYTIEEITMSANHNREAASEYRYNLTPLDFVSRREWWASRLWSHYTNILRHLGIKFATRGKHPANRIRTSRLNFSEEPLHKCLYFWVIYVLALLYASLMFIPWNFRFPTQAEKLAWRYAVVIMFVSLHLWCFWNEYSLRIIPFSTLPNNSHTQKQEPDKVLIDSKGNGKNPRYWDNNKLTRFFQKMRRGIENNSVLKDPSLTLPIGYIIPTYLFGACYCGSRIIHIALDFAELRALPKSAFQTVNWTSFLPNFGS